jgi:glycosyltransferase A (GT-A) superfamily protein (DUF2064 family)
VTPVLLVVARAPVAGQAKTRLAAGVGAVAAAELAAACLLDTLAAARRTGWPVVCAVTGDLSTAAREPALREAMRSCTVVPQRGRSFAERLAFAHLDAMSGSPEASGVLQIGMDTPQVGVRDLEHVNELLAGHGCVVGPARDGGWWVLALSDPSAAGCLVEVPMSTPTTCASTLAALRRRGLSPALAGELDDVDTTEDAQRVAAAHPHLGFSAGWRALAVGAS